MKVIAINGSPRKNWNAAIMLQSALEGAKADGAELPNRGFSRRHLWLYGKVPEGVQHMPGQELCRLRHGLLWR